ncbi:MBG domain-containing protein [Imperialibacter sp.]
MPLATGSYAVEATINDGNHQGSAVATFVASEA